MKENYYPLKRLQHTKIYRRFVAIVTVEEPQGLLKNLHSLQLIGQKMNAKVFCVFEKRSSL